MKKKSQKLIHQNTDVCVDSAIYKQRYPTENAETARALIFGLYSESELNSAERDELERHLEKCSSCNNALKEFERVPNLSLLDSIQTAVCPSSEMLDCFLFDKALLSAQRLERIENHLRECDICTDEMGWLKNLEKPLTHQPKFSPTWLQSVMAAAAALVLALSAFLFWQKSTGRMAEDELRALATIQEPARINYASLFENSEPVEEELQPVFDDALEAFRAHRFREASHKLEEIREHHPRHAATLYLLSYSYYKMNQPEKAFELCSLSESIHPHSYERCMFLVKIALKTHHYDRARIEISSLYHEAPNVPEINYLYHEIMRLTDSRRH